MGQPALCFVGLKKVGQCISRPCQDASGDKVQCARYEVPGHPEPLFDAFPVDERIWPPNHPYAPMHRPGYSDPGPCRREGTIWHCAAVGGLFLDNEVRGSELPHGPR